MNKNSEGKRYVDAYVHQGGDGNKTRTKLRCIFENLDEYKEELQVEILVCKINTQTQ